MPALSSPEKTRVEHNFTGAEIVSFAKNLRKEVSSALAGEKIDDSNPLSLGIIPGFVATGKKIAEQADPFIPKEPAHAVLWALTGIRLSPAKLALDRYEGICPDEITELKPLAKTDSVKVSKNDMKDIGIVLAQLVANHSLASRSLTRLKPDLGDLGRKRTELFEAGKMNELRLLDTILATLSRPKSKEQK